ncbi:MAG: HAD-IA family hydrolase [Candidatus Norongarragalinales archaeon]
MKKNKFKAVVFDLDNTLVDFARMKERACDAAIRAMRSHGLRMPFASAKRFLFELYAKHGIENKNIFQIFLKRTIGRVDYKLLSNAIVAYRREENDFVVPYAGVKETLVALKKKRVKLAVVTDAPRLRAWNRLAAMGLTRFFDFVITLAEAKRRKPHAAPFNAALKKLGLEGEPQHVLFVGDSPGRDMAGAKRSGMRTCLARYGMRGWRKPIWRALKKHFVEESGKPRVAVEGKRVRPDYTIDDVRELVEIV